MSETKVQVCYLSAYLEDDPLPDEDSVVKYPDFLRVEREHGALVEALGYAIEAASVYKWMAASGEAPDCGCIPCRDQAANLATARAALAKFATQPVADTCEWTQDEDSGEWNTGCGHSFEFTYDGPTENGMQWCCYCGSRLYEVPFEEGGE